MDLEQPRHLDLAKSLARLDGALHLRGDIHLHAFACLPHGSAVPGEDRARGARFNSALRFSAEHSKVIVVVVSSDRPVTEMKKRIIRSLAVAVCLTVLNRPLPRGGQEKWKAFRNGENPTIERHLNNFEII